MTIPELHRDLADAAYYARLRRVCSGRSKARCVDRLRDAIACRPALLAPWEEEALTAIDEAAARGEQPDPSLYDRCTARVLRAWIAAEAVSE